MAAVQTRRPFGVLDGTRLQKLTSVKNCQNGQTAITAAMQSPSLKQTLASPGKRRLSITAFDESEDSENIDPSVFNSPSKRSKNFDGTPLKASKFVLSTASPAKPAFPTTTPSARKSPCLSLPNTTTTTPISASRGSLKHKRVGLLAKGRRASSSPFRRIDPPSLSVPTGGLPFSIDEALKGSAPSSKPKAPQPAVLEPVPAIAPILEAEPQHHMPKSWFFDIYEDTPEEEAANMMEHSASVLDISSDDDAVSRRRDEERQKGKENIPPPEHRHLAGLPAGNGAAASSSIQHDATEQPAATAATAAAAKRPRGRKALHPDAMVEDRAALGELPAQDFYADGLDAASNVIIVPGDVTSPQKPSALSKEFDFAVPSPRGKLEAARDEAGKKRRADVQPAEIVICEDQV